MSLHVPRLLDFPGAPRENTVISLWSLGAAEFNEDRAGEGLVRLAYAIDPAVLTWTDAKPEKGCDLFTVGNDRLGNIRINPKGTVEVNFHMETSRTVEIEPLWPFIGALFQGVLGFTPDFVWQESGRGWAVVSGGVKVGVIRPPLPNFP